MDAGTKVLIGIGVAVLLVIAYLVATFNRMVNLRTLIENAWSNIDTELKRRYDPDDLFRHPQSVRPPAADGQRTAPGNESGSSPRNIRPIAPVNRR